MSNEEKILPDYGLIKPITIHPDSKVPYSLSAVSTDEEYDLYFRLQRNALDLLEWSKSCIDIYENHIKDLEESNLTDREKYEIIKGWGNIFQIALENWIKSCEKE